MNVKLYNEEVKKILLAPKNSIVVYLCLLVYAGQNNERIAFPKLDTIEQLSQVNRRGIQRALQKLQELNLIKEEGKTPRGISKYRLKKYKGGYQFFEQSRLEDLQSMTKQGIKKALKNDAPTAEKMSPLRQKNDAPTAEKMSPLPLKNDAPIVNNKLNNNINVNVNTKGNLKMSPLEIPSHIDLESVEWFRVLFSKWSAKPISLWESSNPLGEFFELVNNKQQNLKGKNLSDELRIFEGYLMELEIKRTGGLDKDWSDIPCIFAKRGWYKGLERWLSSAYPSKPNRQRRALILNHGIKIKRPKIEAPENTPIKPPEEQSQPSTPEEPVEGFTGCERGLKMYEYLISKRREFPKWENLYQNISKTHQFTPEQIALCDRYKQLEDLSIIIQTSEQLKKVLG